MIEGCLREMEESVARLDFCHLHHQPFCHGDG